MLGETSKCRRAYLANVIVDYGQFMIINTDVVKKYHFTLL